MLLTVAHGPVSYPWLSGKHLLYTRFWAWGYSSDPGLRGSNPVVLMFHPGWEKIQKIGEGVRR